MNAASAPIALAATATGAATAAAGTPGRSSGASRHVSVESMKESEPDAPVLAPAVTSSDLFR
jgi:hypothetical protein